MPPMILDLFPEIPKDTRNAARYVFGNNNFYIAIGDQIESLFTGLILIDPHRGGQTPVGTLGMLNLITIFQYIESLPDLLAADSLSKRVDWKYALHLPLYNHGLKASAFCEFRKGLWVDQTSRKSMETLLARLSEITWVTRKQRLPLDAAAIVQTVCRITRLEIAWSAMSSALGALAIDHAEWLRFVTLPNWYERYSQRQKAVILATGCSEQEELATAIGIDGIYLINAIAESEDPGLVDLAEITSLKKVWQEQYAQQEASVSWRKEACEGCLITAQSSHPIDHEKDMNKEGNLN